MNFLDPFLTGFKDTTTRSRGTGAGRARRSSGTVGKTRKTTGTATTGEPARLGGGPVPKIEDKLIDAKDTSETAATADESVEDGGAKSSHENSDAHSASEPVVNANDDKKQTNGSPSAILGPDGRLELPMVKNASQEPRYVTLEQWEKLGTEERRRILEEANGTSRFNSQGNNESIEWALWSWNPVTGCLHGCPYCYARDTANRIYETKFNPTLWPDRLRAPKNTPFPVKKAANWMGHKNVFVCSMADLFGGWV